MHLLQYYVIEGPLSKTQRSTGVCIQWQTSREAPIHVEQSDKSIIVSSPQAPMTTP